MKNERQLTELNLKKKIIIITMKARKEKKIGFTESLAYGNFKKPFLFVCIFVFVLLLLSINGTNGNNNNKTAK